MEIYDYLAGGQAVNKLSTLLYRVDDAVTKKLNGDNDPPAVMKESSLINWLAGTFRNPSVAVTYAGQFADAVLTSHMTACAKKLSSALSNTVRREMIGEIYAAVRCKMNGWTMIRGYEGAGHTGIDQIWRYYQSQGQYKGYYHVVVEAKGGRGKLSDRLSYQESYSSTGDPVVLNKVSYSQMTVDWIFIVADSEIQRAFVYIVGKIKKSVPLAGNEAQKACWMICAALYRPTTYSDRATLGLMYQAMGLALGLNDGSLYQIPGVRAVTITNGAVSLDHVFALPIRDWTYKKP